MFRSFFSGGQKKTRPEGYEEGWKLFELGMAYASRFECSKAIDYYNRSIAICKNPAPYINRANLLGKRIRYHEALQDLKEARRLDATQGKEFTGEIQRELAVAELVTSNYRNGIREKLLADLEQNDKKYIAARIFCASFDISSLQWEHNSFRSPLVEYHFFNDLDNVIKFDELSSYPEVEEFQQEYPAEFIEHKSSKCPDAAKYREAELKLHSFLCSYQEEDMQYLRRRIIYDIHCKLMERDYGPFWMSMSSDCPGVTKEAADFMSRLV